MKRVLMALMLVLTLPVMALAAGTVTTSGPAKAGSNVYTITYEWTSDSSNGSVPATAGPAIEGHVFMAVTNPGASGPSDDYDITLTDAEGADVFSGELNDRDSSATEQTVPKIGNAYGSRYVKGTLTLAVTNCGNSKDGKIVVYVYSDKVVDIP